MEILSCKRCNLLLIQADSRSITFECSELTEDGQYYTPSDSYECEHEYYMCPMCSGHDVRDLPERPADFTLEWVKLPDNSAKELLKLWNKLKEDKDHEEAEKIWYGIPLDLPELKEILVESALTK